MDNNFQSSSLPAKVVRRHFELLGAVIPEMERLVVAEGRPADQLLNHFLRTHRELGSRDRRFLSQAVFSFFRWYGWTVQKLGLAPLEACAVGALLDTDQPGPSFDYILAQCQLPQEMRSLGNQPLDEKLTAMQGWFGAQADRPAIANVDLLPPFFPQLVDPAMVPQCIATFQQRPPAWIRSRTDSDGLATDIQKAGIPCDIHPRIRSAISVDGGASLSHGLANHAAHFVVQDLASQCVGLACTPAPGEEWWDCCAGAGGKALHLMDLMEQNGKVLASDVRLEALKELKKRAHRYGIRNIRTQPFNAATDEPFRKTFDGVVVDAPCSGWGTWARNPDARWRTSQKDVAQCANRQLRILNNTAWCVKPGGTMVYAVCTLTRPETEEVAMNFLDQHAEFQLEPFAHPMTGEPTSGQIQIWPWEGPGDAMFIARFRRKGE